MHRQGFEPWTPWLRVRCSTNWASGAYIKMYVKLSDLCLMTSQVHRQGFEPWTPWLRVRCSTNWASGAYIIIRCRNNKKYIIFFYEKNQVFFCIYLDTIDFFYFFQHILAFFYEKRVFLLIDIEYHMYKAFKIYKDFKMLYKWCNRRLQ